MSMARKTILDYLQPRRLQLNTIEIVYTWCLQHCWDLLTVCCFDWVCIQKCVEITVSKSQLLGWRAILAAHDVEVPKVETFTRALRQLASMGHALTYAAPRDKVRENPRKFGGLYRVYPQRLEDAIPSQRRLVLRNIVAKILEG